MIDLERKRKNRIEGDFGEKRMIDWENSQGLGALRKGKLTGKEGTLE